ncbi:MAG: hypothetical protein HZB41_06145 [Ignavibacteriae bacterium]|nr:hypothetical protein [Ignavibacteriota bacterium]
MELEEYKPIAITNEIKLSFEGIKLGINLIKNINYLNTNYFPIFIILSTSIERILKILLFCHFIDINQQIPNKDFFKKNSHNLNKLLKEVKQIAEKNYLYQTAEARKNDLIYLENNKIFQKFYTYLNDFANGGRYYNLNYLLEPSNDFDQDRKMSVFMNDLFRGDQEIIKKILEPPFDSSILYDNFGKLLINHINKFMNIISYFFTQGAFGNKARQYSAFYVNDFLFKQDINL